MKLVLFDIDDKLITTYNNIITNVDEYQPIKLEFIKKDVKDLIKEHQIDAVVSPANCLGFMDGGIDMIYMQLFPGIQHRVQDRIKQFDITTALGRYVLPIGSAIFVSTLSKETPLLVCAPTMFLPEKIVDRDNVYYAFLGILHLLKPFINNDSITVACPGLGTGIGRVPPEKAATQIKNALDDFFNNEPNKPLYSENVHIQLWNKANFVLDKMACDQNKNYANTEMINIAIHPENQKLV